MSIFPSLSDDPQLTEVLQRFPYTVPPLLEYHDRLLRDYSPLTVAERETIAAYVSGLNACDFCHGAHSIAAEAHGVDPELLEAMMADIDTAPIDEKLKAILAYVRKLTLDPSRMTSEDARKVYEAGWDEQALYDAICVCALFNFMNRIVMGSGVFSDPRLNWPADQAGRFSRMGRPGDDPHRADRSYGKLMQLYDFDKRGRG